MGNLAVWIMLFYLISNQVIYYHNILICYFNPLKQNISRNKNDRILFSMQEVMFPLNSLISFTNFDQK